MRPKTHIAIPEPKGTEFENFGRLAGILMTLRPKEKTAAVKKRKPSKTAKA